MLGPGWNKVKVSENLGATEVALVAPADTSLGSNVDGILAWSRPRLSNLLTSSCLIFRPLACLHFKPCLPFESTISPQLHS